MLKKSIIVLLVFFALGTIAETEELTRVPSDHHTENSAEESGFSGSFDVRYTQDETSYFGYRIRASWTGPINDKFNWTTSISSKIEQYFDTLGLNDIYLEQAYVAYEPLENLKVIAGKFYWPFYFENTSVLYSEYLYAQGAHIKASIPFLDKGSVFGNLYLIGLDEQFSGLYEAGKLLKAEVKLKHNVGPINYLTYVGITVNNPFKDSEAKKSSLSEAGLRLDPVGFNVPLSVSGTYGTNMDDLFEDYTYSIGVNFGTQQNQEAGNIYVGVSYYNIDATSWNTALVETDFINAGKEAQGIAVRAQWNPWENSTLIFRYSTTFDRDEEDKTLAGKIADIIEIEKPTTYTKIIAELTFSF